MIFFTLPIPGLVLGGGILTGTMDYIITTTVTGEDTGVIILPIIPAGRGGLSLPRDN
jgi:hypothetical protein